MKERLFKCLTKGRIGPCSGFKWPKIGAWVKADGPLSICENGIHLCQEKDLADWLNAEVYEAEYRGKERIDSDNKIVVREARLTKRLKTWNEKTARLFACDCAEHVLPLFEKEYPDDKRPREAIEIARRYVQEKATEQELRIAGVAARAAWDAAGDAAGAAWAAWAAARDAARDTERKWQTKRLMQYLYPKEKQNEKLL